MRVIEVGSSRGGDSRPSYLLYFVLCVCNNKQTHSRSSSWRGCGGHNWRTASGSRCSSVWPRETSAHQRH